MGNRDARENHDETGQAEGRHGDKTHSQFIEGLHGRHGGSEESEGKPQGASKDAANPTAVDGKHRLFEDRQQHDEAEKNSESDKLRG